MLKLIFDTIVALLAIALLSPVFILLAILIRLKLGTPVLFRQVRPGLQGRPFIMIKFRSMTSETNSSDELLPDAQRLNRFGRFLRATSLDELPSLWNILVGEMSLVGPRPLLMQYLPLYSAEQNRRHEVRPGLTGWAQVNGRNNLSWPEKFRLDIEYLDRMSFWFDCKILLLTVRKVFLADGVSKDGYSTTEAFKGND